MLSLNFLLGSQVRQFVNGHRIPDRGPNDFCKPPKIHSGCPDNLGWTMLDKTTKKIFRVSQKFFGTQRMLRLEIP